MTANIEDIRKLAAQKKAVILAHYYCRPEVQDAADLVGDSLALSQAAQDTSAEVIVFAGVHFMAETASILSPRKKVVLVHPEAGCPMADMVTAEALAARKKELPGVPVLTYVNSSAATKALSDYCCTSANVVAVLRSINAPRVLMTPDQNLAAYAQSLVPEKEVLFWPGFCPVHHRLKADDVAKMKEAHPGALVLAHPECPTEVLALADHISSTSGIIDYCAKSDAREFIILTEEGILHPLEKHAPGKLFHLLSAPPMRCGDMKKNTLEDLRRALDTLSPEVKAPEPLRSQALLPIERMLAVPRG